MKPILVITQLMEKLSWECQLSWVAQKNMTQEVNTIKLLITKSVLVKDASYRKLKSLTAGQNKNIIAFNKEKENGSWAGDEGK